jgi:hypothetical protein
MVVSINRHHGHSMVNDVRVVGACGETKLSNATASLVTSTQAGFFPLIQMLFWLITSQGP